MSKFNVFTNIPDVVIDKVGSYKYIMCLVTYKRKSKIVIRGNKECEFHSDILRLFQREVNKEVNNLNLDISCLGGGYMNFDSKNKIIKIWGKSKDFGYEPRMKTVEILKNNFPNFIIIANY